MSISVAMLRQIAQSVGRAGVDPDEFLRAISVGPDTSGEAYVAIRRIEEVLAQLGRRIGDPVFGLTLARISPMGSLGTFDYAVWASSSLREAIARQIRMYEFVCRGVSVSLETRADEAHVFVRAPPRAPPGVVLSDLALGLYAVRFREALGEVRPRSVTFRHESRARAAYEKLFGVCPAFDAAVDSVAFDAALLDRPLRTANAQAAALLEAHAVERIARLQPTDSLLDAVRGAVVRGLRTVDLDLPRLAADLGQSPRTLQRHLQDRGTNLRDVIDSVRKELAVSMLGERGSSSALVAHELGFSSPRTFVRAFARWTGMTPAEFIAKRRS